MPFGTINVNTRAYDPRKEGVYVLGSIPFGQPTRELRVRGAAAPGKDGNLRSSVTYILEKDIVGPAGATERRPLVVTMNITVPARGFTAAEVDDGVSDISSFLTENTITRLQMGES